MPPWGWSTAVAPRPERGVPRTRVPRRLRSNPSDPLILRSKLDRPNLSGLVLARPRLLESLATHADRPLSLVVSDFHEVAADPAVTAMVDLLLRHLPPSTRILIGSRTMPPLALDRMRTRGELFELDSNHLRFTRAELAQLFEEVYRMPLAEAGIAALDEATLGWPTAVHLVYESLRRSPDRALESVLAELRTSA